MTVKEIVIGMNQITIKTLIGKVMLSKIEWFLKYKMYNYYKKLIGVKTITTVC